MALFFWYKPLLKNIFFQLFFSLQILTLI